MLTHLGVLALASLYGNESDSTARPPRGSPLAPQRGRSRPAVLWFGDSKSREVMVNVGPTACNQDPWSWKWTEPAEDIFNGSSVAGGSLCQPGSELSALAYFLSYGVAAEGPYFRDAYTTKRHKHWIADGCDRCEVSTHSLAKEAVRRFVSRAPQGVPRVVLLSALNWDFGRHHEYFPNQEPSDWAREYRQNFTGLARSVQSSLDPADRLWLVADYPRLKAFAPCGPSGKESMNECLRVEIEMAQLAATSVGDIARELGVGFIDLHGLLLANGFVKLRSSLLNDRQHPNTMAAQMIWAEIRSKLNEDFPRSA